MFYLLFLTFRKYVDEEAIALVDHILFFCPKIVRSTDLSR